MCELLKTRSMKSSFCSHLPNIRDAQCPKWRSAQTLAPSPSLCKTCACAVGDEGPLKLRDRTKYLICKFTTR